MRVLSASVVLVAAVGLAALHVEAQSSHSQRFVQQSGVNRGFAHGGFNPGQGGFGAQGFGPAPQRDFGPQKFVKDPRTGQYVPVQKNSGVHHTPQHHGHIHGPIPAAGLQEAFQVAQQQQFLQQQQQQQHQLQQQQIQQQQIQHQQQQQQFQQQQQQIQQQQIHQQQQNQQNQQFPDVSAFARLNVGQGQADLPYQECMTPGNEEGRCRHLMHCSRPEITVNYQVFLQYACVIQDTYIGVCCTSSSRTAELQQEPQPDPEPIKPTATTPPIPNQPQPPPTTQSTQQPTINPSSATLTTDLQQKLTGNLQCGRVTETINTRIVGGVGTHPGEFPWLVAVMRRRAVPNNYCGGCLISPIHVLTAAHCIVGFDQRDIWVRVGEHNFNRSDESPHANHRILNFFPHPGFQSRTFENDMALLTLAQPVQLGGFVAPICLPEDGESLSGLMVTVAGWGAIRYDGPVSPILRQVKLPVWTNSDCDRAYSQPIRDNMVCAGFPEGGKDACQDDSGGPMMRVGESGRWQVEGLVSFGTKCAEPGKPGVYARVTKFLPWLAQHL